MLTSVPETLSSIHDARPYMVAGLSTPTNIIWHTTIWSRAMLEFDRSISAYQPSLLMAMNKSVREIFNTIDPSFNARLFLVEFSLLPATSTPILCIKPEKSDDVMAHFEDVPHIVTRLRSHILAQNWLDFDPMTQSSQMGQSELRAWKAALEQVLQAEDAEHGWQSFVAGPVIVEGYLLFCVLQLCQMTWDSYNVLKRNTTGDADPTARSLLHALVEEFLAGCTRSLATSQSGLTRSGFDRSRDELHRCAGRRLCKTLALASLNDELIDILYDTLTNLAAMRYEGANNSGQLVIAADGHPNVEVVIRFQRPVPLTDTSGLRKILHMSAYGLSVLIGGSTIYGLGRVVGRYDQNREDLFTILFTGHHTWELMHAGRTLMRVCNGCPHLSPRASHMTRFLGLIQRLFHNVPTTDFEHLQRLALALIEQRHGTILVISDHAQAEAERLTMQATPIRPLLLTPDLVETVTAVDGAILIDPAGTCFAFGVILDGLASKQGHSSRGSRYNSTLHYVQTAHTMGHRCVAMVISEDGPIDIFPDLPLQIKRRAVYEQLGALQTLANCNLVEQREFNRVMSWFQQHRFFLWDEVCTEINALRQRIEPKLEVTHIVINWPEFTPNPELDDSYFSDDQA